MDLSMQPADCKMTVAAAEYCISPLEFALGGLQGGLRGNNVHSTVSGACIGHQENDQDLDTRKNVVDNSPRLGQSPHA